MAQQRKGQITGLPPSQRTVPLLRLDWDEAFVVSRGLAEIANQKWTRSTFYVGLVYWDAEWSDSDVSIVRRWISTLPKPKAPILREIAKYAMEIRVDTAEIRADVKGGTIDVGVALKCRPPNNRAVMAYMFASMLTAGYANNLRQCPECGTYFFDVPKGRPIKKFCSPNHSNAYRQRQHRGKAK